MVNVSRFCISDIIIRNYITEGMLVYIGAFNGYISVFKFGVSLDLVPIIIFNVYIWYYCNISMVPVARCFQCFNVYISDPVCVYIGHKACLA